MPVGAPELRGSIIVGLVGEQNFARTKRGFAGVRGAATRMSKTLDIARRGWVRFTGALRGGFGILRRVATVGLGAFVALGGGITLFARKAVMAASSLEDIQTMLKTAFGTAKAAAVAFAEAEALSIKTPFTPASVAQGAIFLKQLKVTTGEVADLRKWMGLAADMAGAMKRDFLEAVFAIGFGLSGESDRLKQFGITVRDLLGAGALGKLGQGINVRTIQGAERFLKAMETLIGQRFRGGAASLARTLSGLWSTFKGIAQFLWADIATAGGTRGLFGQLHSLVMRINKALQWVRDQQAWRDFTTTLSTGFGNVIAKVKDLITKHNVEEWLHKLRDAATDVVETKLPRAFKKATTWLEKLLGFSMSEWGDNFEAAMRKAELALLRLAQAGLKWATIAAIAEIGITRGKSARAWIGAGGGLAAGAWINKRISELEQVALTAKEAAPAARRGAQIAGGRTVPPLSGGAAERLAQLVEGQKWALKAGAGRGTRAATGGPVGRWAFSALTGFRRLKPGEKQAWYESVTERMAGETRPYERRPVGRIDVRVDVRSHDPAVVAREAGEATRREIEAQMVRKRRAAAAPG